MSEYPYVRAWGQLLRLSQAEIETEVRRAREAGASQNAVYRDLELGEEHWVLTDEIESREAALRLELIVRQMRRDGGAK